MREGPILRIDAFGSIEYAIVDIERTIVSVEQNGDRLVLIPRQEIKVVLCWKLVDLKGAPYRIDQTYQRFLGDQRQGLLQLNICLILNGELEFAIGVVADVQLLQPGLNVHKLVVSD